MLQCYPDELAHAKPENENSAQKKGRLAGGPDICLGRDYGQLGALV